jgi:DNA-binding LytR/AlgR family response regulator
MLVLNLNEIICFKKRNDRYTDIFHRRSGSIMVDKMKSSISDIERQIYPHGFIRPHSSCLVNPLHIKRIYGKNHCKYIETSIGEEILISQHSPEKLQLIFEH